VRCGDRPDLTGGLAILPFESEQQLRAAIDALSALGARVVDPHTWAVYDPAGAAAHAARVFDPEGLLNPGKLSRPRRDPGS
jgi:hypothetical protein